MGYLYLFLALFLNATANVLMKVGAGRVGELEGFSLVQILWRLMTNHILVIGVILFALNVGFYVLALAKIPLTIAYPIMVSGGILIISVISIMFLNESLTLLQTAGILCIILGIVLLAQLIK